MATKPSSSKAASKKKVAADAAQDIYDLEAERLALQPLLEQDVPTDHPEYQRLQTYLLRQAEQLEAQAMTETEVAATSQTSEASPPASEQVGEPKTKLLDIGKFVGQEEDTMTVHTVEAMRMYLGVTANPDRKQHGVPGGRRAASNLRHLFFLTSADNPYADWALVRADEHASDIKKLIAKVEARYKGLLDSMKAKGLSYAVIASAKPQELSLGYRSPYGYTISTLIVLYDYLVRVMKSATRRDLVSKDQMLHDLEKVKTPMRHMFWQLASAHRILTKEEMRQLSRADWLEQADELGQKRRQAAEQILGKVPDAVFVGELTPRHTLRNARLSQKEMNVLRQLINQPNAAATNNSAPPVPVVSAHGADQNLIP